MADQGSDEAEYETKLLLSATQNQHLREIEEALLPLVFEGICSAYRMSEQAVDDVGTRIRGLDKKKIADSMYRMLPDKVGDHDLTLVKNIIPQDRFVVLVQDAFDRFDRFFIQHQRHFDDAIGIDQFVVKIFWIVDIKGFHSAAYSSYALVK